jgi:hypothetical protein
MNSLPGDVTFAQKLSSSMRFLVALRCSAISVSLRTIGTWDAFWVAAARAGVKIDPMGLPLQPRI